MHKMIDDLRETAVARCKDIAQTIARLRGEQEAYEGVLGRISSGLPMQAIPQAPYDNVGSGASQPLPPPRW